MLTGKWQGCRGEETETGFVAEASQNYKVSKQVKCCQDKIGQATAVRPARSLHALLAGSLAGKPQPELGADLPRPGWSPAKAHA